MITADFYSTQTTQYTVEYTDTIDNLTYSDPETIAEPYYMGYVNWDEVPSLYHMSKINVVSEVTESYIEFVDITQTENIPWFFTGNYSSSPYTTSGNGIYIVDENNKYTRNSASTSSSYGFFNSLEIQRVGTYGRVMLYVSANLIDSTTTPPTYTAESHSSLYDSNGNNVLTWNQFMSFVKGEINLHTTTFSAPNESFEISFDDLITGYCEHDYSNGNGKIQIYLTDYSLSYNSRDVQPNGTVAGWSRQNATFKMHANIDGENKPFLTNHMYWHSGYSDEPYVLIANGTTVSHSIVGYDNTIIGGFNGRIPTTFFTNAVRNRWYVFGNFIVRRITSPNTYMQRIIPIMELLQYFAPLATRIGINNQNPAYGFSDIIAYPLFNDDNSPKWEYVTGALEDIQDVLQPWQYTNITANTFTEDDIPEYVPPSPEPGDDQGSNTGSDILRPSTLGVGGTNGFITQYSLTAAQMAEIGRLLWLTFTDGDYYKNFLFTLTTTGTINLSNLLDYFVSLRVYPFPLINVPSHASAGTDMYIGAGIVPLSFSSTLHTINNYADYIDAGSCTIPRFYNDFRDLAHCQISLYLPYCGTVQLNPADVVGGTLSAKYAVDFATGGVTAYVDLTTFDGRQYPIAALSGSIGADIPLTASNAAQIAARIAGDALNFAGTVGEAVSADIGKSAQAIGSAAMGDYIGAAIGVGNVYAGRIGGAAEIAQRGLQIATQEGVKMPMLAGGRGFGAFGAPQTAYVQIRRGLYAEGQTIKAGYKAAYAQAYDQPVQVSSCSGFTVFNNVDTSGLDCDDEERSMIHSLMQSGIII